ncbi:uncharacterized protein LOC143194128 [Rhynchophorus ferrugineus]|uniref:uncharacterized protein LOC143194128 n=1 Tax=Rhynchophorus ferrugineus TaxID=354439 RepID=UPI003FCD7A08
MIIHISFREYSSIRDAFFAGLLHFGTKMKVLIIFAVALSVCLAQRRPSQPSQYQDSQSAETAAQDYQAPEQQYQSGDARPRSRELTTPIPIIRYDKEQGNDGSYKAAWETGNNILAQEEGFLKELGPDPDEEGGVLAAQVQQGSYSYTAPDGQIITVNYIADEKGFHPSGDHLPTPPPVSPEVQKGLDLIYAGIRAQQLYKNGEVPNKPRVNIYRGKTKASGINAANLIDFNIGLIKGQISAKATDTQIGLQSILQNPSPGKSEVIDPNQLTQNNVRTAAKVTKKADNNDADVVLINYKGTQKSPLFESSTERKLVPSLSIVREDSANINTGSRSNSNAHIGSDGSAKRETIRRQPQIYFHSTYNTVNRNRNAPSNNIQKQEINNQHEIVAANNKFSLEEVDKSTNSNVDVKTASQNDKQNINGLSTNSLSSATSTSSQIPGVNHENTGALFSPSISYSQNPQLNKNIAIKDDKTSFKSQTDSINTQKEKALDNSRHVSTQFSDQKIQNQFKTKIINANGETPTADLKNSFNSNLNINNQFESEITNQNNDRISNPLHATTADLKNSFNSNLNINNQFESEITNQNNDRISNPLHATTADLKNSFNNNLNINNQFESEITNQNNDRISNPLHATINTNKPTSFEKTSSNTKSALTSNTNNSNLLFSTQTVFRPPPFNQDQVAKTSISSNTQINNTSSVPNFLLSLTPPSEEISQTNNYNRNNPPESNANEQAPTKNTNASPVPDFLLTLIPPSKQNAPTNNPNGNNQLKSNENDFLSSLKAPTQQNIARSITNQNNQFKSNENDFLSSLQPPTQRNNAISVTNQNSQLKSNENDFLSSLKPPTKQNSRNNNQVSQSVKLSGDTQDLLKLLNINLEDMINAQNKLCSLVESASDSVYEKCSSIVGDVEEFCKNSKRSSSAVFDIIKHRFN